MSIEGKPIKITKCGTCAGGTEDVSLCGITRSGLDKASLQKSSTRFASGENIYFEGDTSQGVYCLQNGLVAIRKTDINGNSCVIRLVQPGETFGHRSFLANDNHTGTAEVLLDCKLCFISKRNLEQILAESRDVSVRFTRRIAKDLRDIEERFLLTTTQSVRKRLTQLLLNLRTHYAEDGMEQDEIVLELPLSRQELAAAIGTRPETVARTIKKLEEDGLAFFKSRLVNIPSAQILLEDLETES